MSIGHFDMDKVEDVLPHRLRRADWEGTILLRKLTEAEIPVFIRLLTWPAEAAM